MLGGAVFDEIDRAKRVVARLAGMRTIQRDCVFDSPTRPLR